MTYQAEPKKQNTYPKLLNEVEKKRKRNWIIDKANNKANFKKMAGPTKVQDVKMVQRFSGKKGN